MTSADFGFLNSFRILEVICFFKCLKEQILSKFSKKMETILFEKAADTKVVNEFRMSFVMAFVAVIKQTNKNKRQTMS